MGSRNPSPKLGDSSTPQSAKRLHVSCFNCFIQITADTIEHSSATQAAFSFCLWNEYNIVAQTLPRAACETTQGLPARERQERAKPTPQHPKSWCLGTETLQCQCLYQCRFKPKSAVPGSNNVTERRNRRPRHPPKALLSVTAQGALKVPKVPVVPSAHKPPPFLEFHSNVTNTWSSAEH